MASSLQISDRPYLPFRGVENDTSAYLPLDPTLNEIRCITILPGSGDDPVTCEQLYTNLDEDPLVRISYTAISYCWGDVSDTVPIRLRCPFSKDPFTPTGAKASCNSQFLTIPFRVTQNLYTALLALRQAPTSHVREIHCFWIDALCINQSDPQEKSHQVGFMGKIYSSAESVLVWLGPEDLYSRMVCGTYRMCLEPLLRDPLDTQERSSLDYSSPRWTEIASTLASSMQQDEELSRLVCEVVQQDGLLSSPHASTNDALYWNAFLISFDRLLSRPWWHRIWVLQEVALAPRGDMDVLKVRLWMGVQNLSWEAAGEIMRTINRLGELSGWRHFAYLQYVKADFASFIWFRVSWWTLTRAMGQPHTRPMILDLMERTRHFKATDPRDRFFALLHIASDTSAIFRTENLISPDYTKSIEAVVRDFTNWQVQQVGPLKILLSENHMEPFAHQAGSHRVHALDQNYSHHRKTTRERSELLSSLLKRFGLKDRTEGRKIACIKAPLSTEFCFSRQTRSLDIMVESFDSMTHFIFDSCCAATSHQPREIAEYGFLQMLGVSTRPLSWGWQSRYAPEMSLERTFSRYTQQCIFSTHDKNIVLGHANVQPGDYVVMLRGVEVPFIIRPLHTGRYQVIGPCWAVDRYKTEQVLDEVFDIEE